MGRLDWENVLDELTPHQFSVLWEWLRRNPQGERRQDWRHAHLVACIANLARSAEDEPMEAKDALAHFLHSVKPEKPVKKVGPAQMAKLIGSTLKGKS